MENVVDTDAPTGRNSYYQNEYAIHVNLNSRQAEEELWQRLEDPAQRNNFKLFSVLKPYMKSKQISRLVHNEFEKHAAALQGAMPELEKLVIAKGYFALRTLQFFPPLRTLEIVGELDPAGNDLVSVEHLA